MRSTIIVPAYNEKENLPRLLDRLLTMPVEKIIVVSSGSVDGTDEVAYTYSLKHPRILFLRQTERLGKASAINQALPYVKTDIVVVVDADVLPAHDALDKIAKMFENLNIGGVGTRNIVVTNTGRFMDYVNHEVWLLHHELCTKTGKLGGDVVAFQKGVGTLPDTAVDDFAVELAIKQLGKQIAYCPDAFTFIHGPKTVSDYVKQRRRIYAGYRHIQQYPATVKPLVAFKVLKHITWLLMFLTVEFYARLLGWWDYHRGKTHIIWERVKK